MKNLLWFAQWWTSYYSCGNPPLCPLDCQSLIFSRFWPWPNASQTHRHPKGGKNLRKCGTKTDTYDPLAMYYGNRKGAGNPKFVPHRSVRWWAVNYRWPCSVYIGEMRIFLLLYYWRSQKKWYEVLLLCCLPEIYQWDAQTHSQRSLSGWWLFPPLTFVSNFSWVVPVTYIVSVLTPNCLSRISIHSNCLS
jgi:hypothetical protein